METCLIFEKFVMHRALRVHHFVRVARVRGKCISGGVSAWFVAPSFLVFEKSCFGLMIDCDEPLPLN